MATYHIDFLNGSNVTGDGTAIAPWATITHTFSQVTIAAGDLIKVAATGTETDIDTAATFSGDNTITTSVDLTTELAVGDLFIVSPKITAAPELDGWMLCEVLTITSDTITTTNLNRLDKVFPDSTAGLVTITKITNFVDAGSSGDYEDFIAAGATNDVLKDVIIEGGYDATFTTATGLTNIFRTGLAFNTTVGRVFSSCTSSGQLIPLIKNFRFSKFLDIGGNNQFFTRPNCQNCHFFTCSQFGRANNQFWGSAQTSNLYFINSGNAMSVGSEDPTNIVNVFCVASQRRPTLINCVGDITLVNQLISAIGSFISSAFSISQGIVLGSLWQKGKLTFTTSTISGSIRNILFRLTNRGAYMDITAVNVINSNPTTGSPYMFAAPADREACKLLVNLPTGVALEDLGHTTGTLNTGGSSQDYVYSDYSIVDGTEVTWTINTSSQLASSTDTTNFVTGSSSRKVKVCFSSLAGGGLYGLPIAKFKQANGGLTLQSVTIKAKKSSNFTSINTQLGVINDSTLSPIVSINTDTFQDYTYNIPSVITGTNPEVEQLLFLGIRPLQASTTSADSYIWIDSVTFNYA